MNVGIISGTSLNQFAISFDYLGTGTPGAQRFDIIDPNTFATLSTGFTNPTVVVPPPTSDVPEPNSLALVGLAPLLILIFRRRSQTKNMNAYE